MISLIVSLRNLSYDDGLTADNVIWVSISMSIFTTGVGIGCYECGHDGSSNESKVSLRNDSELESQVTFVSLR